MTTDIFIRTYQGDLEWLKYALKSIAKYVTGYRNIIIIIPENQFYLLKDFNLTKEKIFSCPVYKNDYLGQQATKANAYQYSDADFILFWDSDCIATEPFDVNEMFQGGRPIILKTKYSSMTGDVLHWQRLTQKATGQKPVHEYMRRFPLIYRRETLQSLQQFILKLHGLSLEEYIIRQPNREFSEFNVFGFFAELFEENNYVFLDTETINLPKSKLRQYRSWDGITQQTKNEIESIL